LSGVILNHLVMKRESKSFTDSLHAILTAAGLFQGPKYMLSGYTGMAFKFSVHRKLLPMSVSAYGQWGTEHQPAVDNLGLFTVSDGGRTRHPTFGYYQRDAVKWIKESLNQGRGVIYWIPEFGVIHGYDDGDGVFFVQDGIAEESRILLYDNFGLNFTPFWYCQIIGDKVELNPQETILESFRLAVDDWNTPHKTLPDRQIASGKLAYTFLIQALQKGEYDERGAVYILESYIYSRQEIRDYLHAVQGSWQEAEQAFRLFDQLVGEFGNRERFIELAQGSRRILRNSIGELVAALQTAETLEDRAMDAFRELSARYPDPKRTLVPRWGVHTPK